MVVRVLFEMNCLNRDRVVGGWRGMESGDDRSSRRKLSGEI